MKAIVVGAGMAGLAAVHTLRKAGAEVVCYEKADVPGGRVATKHRDGFVIDTGAAFLFKEYRTCFVMADELGISSERRKWLFRVGFPDAKMKFNPVVASVVPREVIANLGETLRFVAGGSLSTRAKIQFARTIPTLVRRWKDLDVINYENSLDLDRESTVDYLTREFGQEVLDELLGMVASFMTLSVPGNVAAGYGLALFTNMLGGLNTYRTGIDGIARAIANRYALCMRYNTPVEKIVIENGKVKGVEVGGTFVEADVVISAVTATKLLQMATGLPEAMRKPLETVRYSACCQASFAYPIPLLPHGWFCMSTPASTGSIMVGFGNMGVKSESYTPEGCSLISCYTTEQVARELNELPDDQIKKRVLENLRRFLPNLPAEPLFTDITRWREAVCTSPTGMLSAITRMKQQHYRDVKGLFLAGEYMNMPAVESAAHSGVAAAQAAVR